MSDLYTRVHTRLAVCCRRGVELLRTAASRDDGTTTETVLIVALLALLAITVVGIIAAKVTAKANGINL